MLGDSLSDKHNMFNASRRLMPNRKSWSGGRFSNGSIWPEYLGLNLPVSILATGGAASEQYLVVEGLAQQVASFKHCMKWAKSYKLQYCMDRRE